MSKKAVKGLAVAGVLAVGTGAIVKAAKYLKNRTEREEEEAEEEALIDTREREKFEEKREKLLESLEELTGAKYRIAEPTDEDTIDLKTTIYLKQLEIIDSEEAVIIG